MKDKNLENVSKTIWFILYFSVPVLLIYVWVNWIDIAESIALTNPVVGKSLTILLLFALAGMGIISFGILDVIDTLFWPKTNEELKLNKDLKMAYKIYPRKVATLRRKELRLQYKINKVEKDIKKEEKKK